VVRLREIDKKSTVWSRKFHSLFIKPKDSWGDFYEPEGVSLCQEDERKGHRASIDSDLKIKPPPTWGGRMQFEGQVRTASQVGGENFTSNGVDLMDRCKVPGDEAEVRKGVPERLETPQRGSVGIAHMQPDRVRRSSAYPLRPSVRRQQANRDPFTLGD
jgi:hypothetical protein